MNDTRPSEYELPDVGDVVAGKYRVVSVLGTGGMGVVLGAFDTSLGRNVAIKFLAPHKAARDGATARFAREARAAAALQSEYVVRVYDVGALPTGASYIVMEHLVGSDLAETLEARGPLPIDEAVDYVLQACDAIGEAHGRGIIHRDLKPQNLFLTHLPNGRACVKVLDFGISKAEGEDSDAEIITWADTVMGTPLYMSPEQMRSLESVDWRSDIWALGAILFELLTASPVFDAETTVALCAMIASEAPIPLRQRRPDAPAPLEAAILRCLHKDPNGRYQDIATLAEALAPFASERGRISGAKIRRTSVPPSVAPKSAPPAAFETTSDLSEEVTRVLAYRPAPSSTPPLRAGAGSSFPPSTVEVPVPRSGDPRSGRAHVRESGVHSSAPRTGPPVPTTQQSWQPASMRPSAPVAPRRASSTAVVTLGVLASVAVIAVMGRGGYLVYSKRTGSLDRDTSSALPRGDATNAEQCARVESLLRSNDPKNNLRAREVKDLVCARASGPQGSHCDRTSCRSACSAIQDKECLVTLENGERSFPARF